MMKISIKHFIGILLLFFACDSLFSTRDPELPVNPQSNWIQPLSADQVLINLQNAISDRNVENYTRCIVNPLYSSRVYRFDADSEVAANHPDVFQSWDRDKEKIVMQQAVSMVPSDSAFYLAFIEEIQEIVVSDSAIIVRKYRLGLHHTESSLPNVYEGHVEFWLAPDKQGEWSIYRWIDNSVTDCPSWSLLKASLGG